MIQISRSATAAAAADEALALLGAEFRQRDFVRLPAFLGQETLREVQAGVRQGEFFARTHDQLDSNRELCLKDNGATNLLFFLMNQQHLFRNVEAITGCATIGHFIGRVYRMTPGEGHHDAWHDDLILDRMVAVSINLGEEPHLGGVLELRDRRSGQVQQVANTGFGDAIIFRLARHLEHRITDVAGHVSKTAFAGWFRARPTLMEMFQRGAARSTPG